MRILYIFPHPDDESFGPSPAIHQQLKQGHEVHLLTLTRGGATKERHKLGLDIEAMGALRVKEMEAVNAVLKLTSMTILNLEDGGLSHMNPVELEKIVAEHILQIKPNIVVTYPQHGISGHFDHLTIHAIVKYLYAKGKQNAAFEFWKRLAFFTLGEPNVGIGNPNAKFSLPEHIDCIVPLQPDNVEMLKATLQCYKSYEEVIANYDVINHIGNKVHFEFWDENFDPPLQDITANLTS